MMTDYMEYVIERLGYSKAEGFYTYENIPLMKYPPHTCNVLKELKPCAVYMVGSRPFVCFFDMGQKELFHRIGWKIWNSQIDIAVCVSDTTFEVYYGKNLDQKKKLPQRLEKLSLKTDKKLPFSCGDIRNEGFWQEYRRHFKAKNTLNHILLENVQSVTDQLKQIYHIPFTTKFMLRIIFIRYMIDRGVDLCYEGFGGEIEQSRQNLVSLFDDKNRLYLFFKHLKHQFNGNLFDAEEELEDPRLNREALKMVARFLTGKERMQNGQFALFNMYDFNVIPVETISSIYEIILGEEARRKNKAFYTPSFLVDYIIQTECDNSQRMGKMLDPACGSGIFLVCYYRKLVEQSRISEGISGQKLISLMRENIFGVDKEYESINVAVFSLYLTLLDYLDSKQVKNLKLPDLIGESLFCADFFQDEALMQLRKQDFQFIIGNPPWGRMDREESCLHVRYCNENGLPQQNEEISRSFLYKVREYCNQDTKCCLILPSKLFYNRENPARECRRYLLEHMQITSLLEMSSVVDGLFENADAPAAVLSFRYQDNVDVNEALLKHISLKPTLFFRLFRILTIEKDDVKYVRYKLLLENDWLWKTLVYGGTGDYETIAYLQRHYETVKERIDREEPPLICGVGVEYHDGENDAGDLVGRPFFRPRGNIGHGYINLSENSFKEFKKDKIHRTRKNSALYSAPYCLLTKGVDPKTYRMRAVCCEDRDFVFPETIYGIKGQESQLQLLYTLSGLFNSSLYAYYNFMVGASVGIDRRQRFIADIMQCPYPDHNEDRIARCSRDLYQLGQKTLLSETEISDKLQELDECIMEAFHLKDNVYIQYANDIMIPMITEKSKKLYTERITAEGLKAYARVFYRYFADVYEPEEKYVKIVIDPNVGEGFAAMLLSLEENSGGKGIMAESIQLSAEAVQFCVQAYNEAFYWKRNCYYFEENGFLILKSNNRRNWQMANAYTDLSEIIERIVRE